MTVREKRGHLDELNGIDVSPDLISTINDAVGSGRGGERAVIFTALETARLNGIDPKAGSPKLLTRLAAGHASLTSIIFCRGTGGASLPDWRHDREDRPAAHPLMDTEP